MNIKNFVIFFHEWFKKPSVEIESYIKEVDDLLVGLNLQRKAMFTEDFGYIFLDVLSLSVCVGGNCEPVIFIGPNVYWQMLNLTEEVEDTDVACLSSISEITNIV